MKKADHTYKSLVVDILSKSFDDNQSINYIVKQDSKRKERIEGLMEYCFKVCLAKGQIFISDNDKSCALILHPEKKMGAIKEMLLELKLAISSIGVIRSFKVLKREKLIKQNQPKEPFYYLWFIGVAPDAQGKGIGSALIEEVFQKYNEETRPFYLETSVVKNLSWYEKYGFKLFKELDLGHKLYLMLRPKR